MVSILDVMFKVDSQPRTVVLDHAMDDDRIRKRRNDVVIGFLAHEARLDRVISTQRIGIYRCLRLEFLRKEEPVIPIAGKTPVHALQVVDDRNAIDDR